MKKKIAALLVIVALMAPAVPVSASSAGACSHYITTTKHWKSYPWKHKFSYSPINTSYHRVWEAVYYLDSYSHTNTFTCAT